MDYNNKEHDNGAINFIAWNYWGELSPQNESKRNLLKKKPIEKVPKSVKMNALKLLAPDQKNRYKEVFGKFSAYIDNEFSQPHNNVVMHEKTYDFWTLCQSLNLDIGKREVIITSECAIQYSDHYSIVPNSKRAEQQLAKLI